MAKQLRQKVVHSSWGLQLSRNAYGAQDAVLGYWGSIEEAGTGSQAP